LGWNPAAYEQALRDEFDQLYEEGAHRRRMMVTSLHDRISGYAGRVRALDRFPAYAKSKGDVWFARKDEIAVTYWPIAPERRSPIEARRVRRACLGPRRMSLMETLGRPGHIRDERPQADNRKEYEMPTLLTRRQILGSGVAMAGTISLLPMAQAAAALESPAAKLRLTADTRTLDVNGKPARVFGLTGPNGKPGITLSPGERFRVDLVNRTGTSTIIHWHGQLPPWTQDGFPWPQTPPIAAGDTHSYDYAPIPGTFWMHSHQGMQEQSLMTAPLIVHSAEDLRADRQEVVLMLHDFSFRTPDELLAGLTKSDGRAG
jgi:multicopper oxidase